MAAGALTKCRKTFSGADGESVEAFIDGVDSFINCVLVPDCDVVRDLSTLLFGRANTWWLEVKPYITCWREAKESLLTTFGEPDGPYKIYKDIFALQQRDECTEVFVARVCDLFSKLPTGDITEKVALDMTYGLLHARIRRRLPRERFSSFTELVTHAKAIEIILHKQYIREIDAIQQNVNTSSKKLQLATFHPLIQPPPSTIGGRPRPCVFPRTSSKRPIPLIHRLL